MSILTDTLDRILVKQASFDRRCLSCFVPGLSRDRILEMTAHIPHPIPEEAIELYQWHNGIYTDPCDNCCYNNLIPCFKFQTLKHAVETKTWCDPCYYGNTLPIMTCDGKAHLVALLDRDSYIAPVWSICLECGIYDQ
jgi:hypothetical protein